MDNHQMKVDSYGRLIHVPEYPNNANFPTDNTSMEIGNISSKGINVKQADAPWNTPYETWARAERVKRLEESLKELWDKVDDLQVANWEITRTLSTMVSDGPWTTLSKMSKKNWVEEELEAIKNMPNERTCKWCKWGEKLETRTGFNCHYYPDDIDVAGEHWCSKWCEK